MACFSCFSTRYLSRTLKANFFVVPWHFLTDVALGSPAKEKEWFRRVFFCLQRWQARSFIYLLTYWIRCLVYVTLFIASGLIFEEVEVVFGGCWPVVSVSMRPGRAGHPGERILWNKAENWCLFGNCWKTVGIESFWGKATLMKKNTEEVGTFEL